MDAKADKHADDEIDRQDGPPSKRRMTSKPPGPSSMVSSSPPPALVSAASTTMSDSGIDAGNPSSAATTQSIFGGAVTPTNSVLASATAGAEKAAAAADPEERPIDRLFSERVVTILVGPGPSPTTWRLHENILSSASDFFRSAFNGGFRESLEDRLHLPEDDARAFELLVRWLYTRAVLAPGGPSPNAAASSSSSSSSRPLLGPGSAASAPSIQDYLRLYVLAAKLLIEDLENVCVDTAGKYYKVGTRRPDVRDVQYVYDNTPPGAGMRRLMRERLTLGLFRGKHNNPVTAEWRDVLNETPDLGFDIVSEVSGYNWVSGGNVPARMVCDECAFHRHENGEVCRKI